MALSPWGPGRLLVATAWEGTAAPLCCGGGRAPFFPSPAPVPVPGDPSPFRVDTLCWQADFGHPLAATVTLKTEASRRKKAL